MAGFDDIELILGSDLREFKVKRRESEKLGVKGIWM